MTKAEIKAELDKLGVRYTTRMLKAELEALLRTARTWKKQVEEYRASRPPNPRRYRTAHARERRLRRRARRKAQR